MQKVKCCICFVNVVKQRHLQEDRFLSHAEFVAGRNTFLYTTTIGVRLAMKRQERAKNVAE